MNARAVLFDFGHTLFDTSASVDFVVEWSAGTESPLAHPVAAALWEEARVRSRSADEITKGRDRSPDLHRSCWTALWHELEARCPGVAAALYEFESGPFGWIPYADTNEVMSELSRRGIPIAVVSDVGFDLRPIFRHHGLDHHVDTYVLSYERGSIKPDGKLFGVAAAELGVPLAESLMVGDNHLNDGAGVSAGVTTLLLPAVASGCARGLATLLPLVRM